MSVLAAGDRVVIRKLKYRSGEYWMMWQWNETVWQTTGDFLIAYESPGIHYTRDEDAFVGLRYAVFYFYPGEPFHFYELYAPEPPHPLDGWYCNINLPPQRTADGYSFVDLDLDLWVNPDLTYRVLDEDELRDHAVRYQYTDEMCRVVEETRRALLKRIRQVEFPFRRNIKTIGPELAYLSTLFQTPAPDLMFPTGYAGPLS